MAENLVTRFVMNGAREAMAGGLVHIEEQIKGIERAVIENPGLAFDLARTLIESTCKTILSERAVAFALDDDLPRLFRAVTMRLPFLPQAASENAEARRSLVQTLGGLNAAVQGICELRNQCGFASHGTGAPRAPMETVQALLAAQAADTIIGFLHRVHRQERATPPVAARLEYENHPDFNEYVDEQNGAVRIFEFEYKPSEVLFAVDGEAYRDSLANWSPEEAAGDSGAAPQRE